ncbi:hypothetical protein H0H81_003968 [Sphagnurus paluster]|uniref:Uncharacterized protein n=1 Tax=Sphagnurus paluster TaxID=117069 RepID=A0A9P7GT80_9AGAR|nr:hypothetical protein H0H81_003968 [Sphagnurus paluster]
MLTKTSGVYDMHPLRRRTNVMDSKAPALEGQTHTTHAIKLSRRVDSVDPLKDVEIDGIDIREDEKKLEFLTDDESISTLSEDEEDRDEGQSQHRQTPLAQINTENLPPRDPSEPSPMSPNTRAWYEFDLAVVVALVSPIGNWLTGGDYIKNVFLIIMLIFYLHQIIEVPWELYRKARPRRRAEGIAPSTTEDKYQQIAASELRLLEFFFLALTAASPFLGAIFLRYATAAVIGAESVSWFSTTLFVLATGMRPWAHLIERLKQRTSDLHDVIHYPSPAASAQDMHTQMDEMHRRMEHLERALSKAKKRLTNLTEEVYDYVDEAVTAVDRTVKRHERNYEKQEVKVKEMEQKLEGLRGKSRGRAGLTINTMPAAHSPPLLTWVLPSWMYAPQRKFYSPSYSPSKHSMRTFSSASSPSSTHLETIPEEETLKYPVLAQPANLTALVLSRIGYFATMPLRAVVRMVLRRY